MTSDYLRTLFDYHYWAMRRIWNCIAALTPEQFTQPLDYSVGSIRNQVVHTMSAEWNWFSRLGGTSQKAMLDPDEYPTPESVQAAWSKLEADHRAYLSTLTDDRLEQDCAYTTMRGILYTDKVGIILFHVLNHATDHRAQILAMLHALGAPTVEQDLIFYVREQQ